MKERIEHWRWVIADWLSFLACKLRGHQWVDINCWGVSGNHASEVKQNIWMEVVLLPENQDDREKGMSAISRYLDELGQMAGENWGHFPKVKP